MKFLIFITVICSARVYGGQMMEFKLSPEMKKINEECAKENNINLSNFISKIGEMHNNQNISKEFKCFERCKAIKQGFIDEAGKSNYDKVKKAFNLTDAKISEIKNCTSTASDKCDNYYEIFSCTMKLFWKNHDMFKFGHCGNQSPEMKKWSEECAKENKIDLSSMKNKIGEMFMKRNISKEFKCFERCKAIKQGLIDENGKPNYEKAKSTFNLTDEKIAEIKNCTSTAEDKCDNYFEIHSCAAKLVWKNHNMFGDFKFENPEMKKINEACAKENNINLKSLKATLGDLFNNKNVSNEFKCYERCKAVKQGFIDENGKPNYDKVKKTFKLSDEKIKLLKNCTSNANDKCDNYYEIHTCSMKLLWKNNRNNHFEFNFGTAQGKFNISMNFKGGKLNISMSFGHSEQQTPQMKQINKDCAKEHKIDLKSLESKMSQIFSKNNVSKDFKCFERCKAIRQELIESNGTIIYENVKKTFKLDDEKMNQIKTCTSNATDECDNFFEIQNCCKKLFFKNVMFRRGNQESPEMKKLTQECATKHNIDLNTTQSMMHENQKNVSNDYKCFERCKVIKQGFMDESGKRDFAKIQSTFKLDDAQIAKAKKCTSTAEDKCDNFYEILTCSMKICKKDMNKKKDKKEKN